MRTFISLMPPLGFSFEGVLSKLIALLNSLKWEINSHYAVSSSIHGRNNKTRDRASPALAALEIFGFHFKLRLSETGLPAISFDEQIFNFRVIVICFETDTWKFCKVWKCLINVCKMLLGMRSCMIFFSPKLFFIISYSVTESNAQIIF